MKRDLTLYETRVIGVLLEKEITTPEQYPLSLNALTNACNQKSNRYPVLELDEAVVKQTVEHLVRRGLVKGSSQGGRVEKYHHWFCNTQFGELKLSAKEVAVVCELLLRGPQTPGELRARAARMASFHEVAEVEATLNSLANNSNGALVAQLPREPGKRESRFAHLFSTDIEPLPSGTVDAASLSAEKARIVELEAKVAKLETEVEQLRQRLRALGQAV